MVKRWCLWNMKLYETQFGLQYPKEIIKLTNLDFVRFESMAFYSLWMFHFPDF